MDNLTAIRTIRSATIMTDRAQARQMLRDVAEAVEDDAIHDLIIAAFRFINAKEAAGKARLAAYWEGSITASCARSLRK